jgi:hypothetical protein
MTICKTVEPSSFSIRMGRVQRKTWSKEDVVMSEVLLARPCLRRQGVDMTPRRMEALVVATKMWSQVVRTYGVDPYL